MRILGIDPTTGGLGFVVLETDNKLIDWGIKHVPKSARAPGADRTATRKARCVIVEALFSFYRPDVLALEDWTAAEYRRGSRATQWLKQATSLAARHDIAVCVIASPKLANYYALLSAKTRLDVAMLLSQLFPELAMHLPKKRKPWGSESLWMNVFMALGRCVALFENEK